MLRLVGCRLGGRVRRRSKSAIIDAAVNAVLAELRAKATKAKKSKRAATSTPAAAVKAPAKRTEQLEPPPAGAPPPPATTAAPAKAKTRNASKNLVDTVLSGVNCTLLKHVLSSSSSSSTSTDIPDVGRVLRLDYTTIARKHQLAHLADILLVNRIHAAVVNDTHERTADGASGAAADASSPLVVLVETTLPREDAEVQEFIIRNALSMHPLPPEVATEDGQSVHTPPLTVLVLGDEQTKRVRTLAELPPVPPRVPAAAPLATAPATNSHDNAQAASAAPASDRSAAAEAAPSTTCDNPARCSLSGAPAQGAPQRKENPKEANSSTPPKADAAETATAANAVLPSASSSPVAAAAASAESVPTLAATAAAANTAPPVKTAASEVSTKRVERAVRRVARVSLKALAAQKKRRPATPSQARLVASIAATVSGKHAAVARPPRLLSVDSSKEKLLWASQPGRPLPIRILEPLVSPAVYEEVRTAAAADASASSVASPLTMHMVVYGVSKESSASTVWLGALQAAAELTSAMSSGASQLPAEVAELAGLDPARVRRVSERKSSRKRCNTKAAAVSSVSDDGTATAAAPMSPKPYVYILIHTRLSREDAAVLQQELQYQLMQLKATPAGAEVAGMSVLTAEDVSPAHLSYVLEHSMVEGGGDSVKMSAMRRGCKSGMVPSAAPTLSAEAAEVSNTFQEVYRLLSEQPWLLSSPLQRETPSSSSPRQQHPDTLVADAIRIAALTQVLVQRKEAQLRGHFEAAQQSSAMNADSEAVARAAQRVEMKTMVTEAVEEVSVRHEQATAHLVKTLSSIVGQWSLEKLSDTLEAIVRDEVKPIMDVLEERLASTPGRNAEAAGGEAAPIAAAPALMATPASTSPTDSADAASSVLLERQDEIKGTMSQALAQLRELSERLSALAAATTAAAAAKTEGLVGSAAAHPPETAAAPPKSEEELRLLRNLHELQEQHHSKLSDGLESLRSDLRYFASQERAAAEAQATVPAAAYAATLSKESLDRAVADTVHEITHAIRRDLHASVVEQLDAYCDVHRSTQNSAREDRRDEEPSTPVLPVTSFELEEMLTRVVEHTVRTSTDKIEDHVRAAIEKSYRNQQAADPASVTAAASTTSATESDEALKAALERLWAQVRAEAAEEEAVKVSQHNRQLLRLLRRQKHLQRCLPGCQATSAPASASSPASPLSYVALEEAMRVVMHPYMAQMQATVAAAAAGSPRTSVETSSSTTSADDGVEQDHAAHPASRK
ncbi:conserved hypothetical protein [Leishmania major strain Friedlin]|uniref:Uncharacterized protein n=1 Tax=Leishmania major TaxID=5664 RepID=Q4QDA9_LEIMA|nr:conserved hypothetical protein [Leishmania major strain Friedlin]CAG9572811.1 hypothetical_protein_-_conserved [Leishmania major strain Friedlin]CAJ07197.1 conserved hypothetical protein [Leishmania major strain Friedlin]|eukprot:XP_001682689.1 conserved hypothetical protein [Leishmania major strain Friedlin]